MHRPRIWSGHRDIPSQVSCLELVYRVTLALPRVEPLGVFVRTGSAAVNGDGVAIKATSHHVACPGNETFHQATRSLRIFGLENPIQSDLTYSKVKSLGERRIDTFLE